MTDPLTRWDGQVKVEVDGHTYSATIKLGRVSISERHSGVNQWCGDGRIQNGSITDCPADLGDETYEALDEAIGELARKGERRG